MNTGVRAPSISEGGSRTTLAARGVCSTRHMHTCHAHPLVAAHTNPPFSLSSSQPAGMFTSTATQAGGEETTIMTSVTHLVHHGMIFVAPGYTFGEGMHELAVPKVRPVLSGC